MRNRESHGHPSQNPKILQQVDAPYAVGAMWPREFIRQVLSVFMCRSTAAPKSPRAKHDLKFRDESEFWANRDLLSAATLEKFYITDWFPRTPGVFWSDEASMARQRIEQNQQKKNEALGSYYEPAFKSELIEHGGIGSIRLRPRIIDNELCWLGTAYTGKFCHRGVPVAIPDSLLKKSGLTWGECTKMTGSIRFLDSAGLADIGEEVHNASPLILFVEKLKGKPADKEKEPVLISPVVMFKRQKEWIDYGYPPATQYTFVNCHPAPDQLSEATNWMKRYAQHFEGDLITNFDEQKPILPNVPLSYQRLVKKTYDKTVLNYYTDSLTIERVERFDFKEVKKVKNVIKDSTNAILVNESNNVTIKTSGSGDSGLSSKQTKTLDALIKEITSQLDQIKEEHPDEKRLMEQQVENARAAAMKPPSERKKPFFDFTADGLIKTAQLVSTAAPAIIQSADKLAAFIQGLV